MTDPSQANDPTADPGGSGIEELERIFDLVAAEPRDRQCAMLERLCPDPELREQVRSLLEADGDTDLLLDHSLVPEPVKLAPGELIGPYHLLEEIGHGGMGVVYLAEQLEPIRRNVALKVIKPGVDTRQVIARFEAERQALSVMNHPNIARALDAGTTDTGRPYFVMELVQGQPITDYCDHNQLTARERLELLIPVCNAIQHAHQKGIIHRDIKPSNVLVTEYDGRPAAKVIDFGVAKAIDQAMSDLTVFTGFGQIVGTFEYMSPEQSQLNQTDIDTRSDIYSLGVLLYELLTGSPPFDKKRLRSVAWDEMLRIIREEDPPRPSSRLSATTQPADNSESAQNEPEKFKRSIRTELDWIVMKAMEKDRTRRYDTPNALADDLRRFLKGDAVAACPPSRWYQFRKFAVRNKVALATTAIVAASLVLGLIGTSLSLIRARRAEEETTAFSSFVVDDVLGLARAESQLSAGLRPDSDLKLLTLLDRARVNVDQRYSDKPQVRARIKATLANSYRSLGRYTDAAPLYEGALAYYESEKGKSHAESILMMRQLGKVYLEQGRLAKAESLLTEALPGSRNLPDPKQGITRQLLDDLGTVHYRNAQYQLAEATYNECLTIKRTVLGDAHPETLTTMSKLALTCEKLDRTDDAELLHKQVLKGIREIQGDNDLGVPTALSYLGRYYLDRGRRTNDASHFDSAAAFLGEARELYLKFPGEGRPSTLENQGLFAQALCEQRRHKDAERLLTDLIDRLRNQGDRQQAVRENLNRLGWVYLHQGRLEEAENLLTDLLKSSSDLQPDDPLLLQLRSNLAIVDHRLGKLQAAIDRDEETLKLAEKVYGAAHPETLAVQARLGLSYIETGETDQGHKLLESALESGENLPGAGTLAGVVATSYTRDEDTEGCISWTNRQIENARKTLPNDSVDFAKVLAICGTRLIRAQAWPEAETTMRECEAIRAAQIPDSWLTFNAQSLLGEILTAQQKYDEAKRLLLNAYTSLSEIAKRPDPAPSGFRIRYIKSINRLIAIHDALNNEQQSKSWRKERARIQVETSQ